MAHSPMSERDQQGVAAVIVTHLAHDLDSAALRGSSKGHVPRQAGRLGPWGTGSTTKDGTTDHDDHPGQRMGDCLVPRGQVAAFLPR